MGFEEKVTSSTEGREKERAGTGNTGEQPTYGKARAPNMRITLPVSQITRANMVKDKDP